MTTCTCEQPRMNDRRPNHCRRCGLGFDKKWVSSDETMFLFQTQLAELPGVEPHVMLDSIRRERAGRDQFGMRYIGRDNAAEGQEESSDGLNYAFFAWLNDRRNGIEEVDVDLLDAAHHSALAHAAFERYRRKR